MRRRELILGIAGAAAVARPAAAAEGAKIVGILAPAPLRPIASFKRRLAELGWVEGRNIRFEERWAEGDDNRYEALAPELVKLPVDAVLTWSTPAALAAKVQQAATFQLVFNMRASKALGLAIPPGILTRADEVIE